MSGDPQEFNLGVYRAKGGTTNFLPDHSSIVPVNQAVMNFTQDQNVTMTFNHTGNADVKDHIVMAWGVGYVLLSTDYYILRRILSDHMARRFSHIAIGLHWMGRILQIQESGERSFLLQQIKVPLQQQQSTYGSVYQHVAYLTVSKGKQHQWQPLRPKPRHTREPS